MSEASVGPLLWIDPGFGASGDMLLGALLGLGAELGQIRDGLAGLDVDGWSIDREDVVRCGLTSTRAIVTAPAAAPHHRSWSSIDDLLGRSDLPLAVADGSRATFRRLGEVEAAQHGVPIDEVHFHEVGAVDAIVDIVGVWLGLHLLGLDQVRVGPVGLGHGSVKASHGVLPLPAPATVALLTGAPIRSLDTSGETCTPTGAALLSTMATSVGRWGPIPSGTIRDTGRGAGGRDPSTHPNVVTMIVVETDERATTGPGPQGTNPPSEPSVVLATNVDDATPEVLGHTLNRMLAAGAADAWLTPIVMKKNRPGHELSVLTTPERAAEFRHLISIETGTLGIRQTPTTKYPLSRRTEEVVVRGARVRIKIGPHSAKPEHDDLVAVADATGEPVRLLAQEAQLAWSTGDADQGSTRT